MKKTLCKVYVFWRETHKYRYWPIKGNGFANCVACMLKAPAVQTESMPTVSSVHTVEDFGEGVGSTVS